MSDFEDNELEEKWVPPTEGELKVLEARRERQDKISKIMGQYLLKGYKMLASTCPTCSTILMRTRPANGSIANGEDFCISCNELDSDISKDDPVLDLTAARSQILEGQAREIEAQDLRSAQGETRMASGDGSAITNGGITVASSNTIPATEARPSNPEGAVSSAQPMRMGRPDTGATQIESCTALGCLRKCDPPRVSSDEVGSRARCSMMVICPSVKVKDTPSKEGTDQSSQQNNASSLPVTTSSYHHQGDFCPIHHHQHAHSAAPMAHQHRQHPYNMDICRIKDSLTIVLDKMDWASDQLQKSSDVEQSRQLCSLISCCAEAVSALKAASSLPISEDRT